MKKAILQLGSCVLIGILGFWLEAQFPPKSSPAYWSSFIGFLGFSIPAVLLGGLFFTLPHELGHILAGRRLGFYFGSLRILGLTIWRFNRRWNFQWDFRFYPPCKRELVTNHPDVVSFRKMLLAGPLVSIGMAVLCSPLITLAFTREVGYMLVGGHVVYAIGAFIGSTDDNPTDSYYLMLSYKRPEECSRWLMKQYNKFVAWQRPSNYFLANQKLRNDPDYDGMIHMNWYWKLMDSGKVDEAEEHIRNALLAASHSNAKKTIHPESAYEAAMYFRRFKSDESLARLADEMCQKFAPEHEKKDYVEGAKLWVEGNKKEAVKVWNQVHERYNAQTTDPGYLAHARDWFLRLRTEDMVFESNRLFARLWRLEDADEAFAIYGDYEVQRYLGRQPQVVESLDAMREILERRLEAQKMWKPGQGAWALVRKEDEKLIGCIICKGFPEGERAPEGAVEIGWHLGREFWSNGYATEAAKAVIEYGFDHQPRQEKFVAVVYPNNVASKRVAEKIGMTHLGQSDDYYGVMLENYEIRRLEKS